MIEASRSHTIHKESDMRSDPTLLVDDPVSHARIAIVEEREQLREGLARAIDLLLTAGVGEKVWANVGGLTASILVLTWNFVGYKFFVFKK